MLTNQQIRQNIDNVILQIAALKKRHGISRQIFVVGASKTQPKSVTDFIAAEHLLEILGENRVQELQEKFDQTLPIKWHLIGALQTNKVKLIVEKVDLIHSLDSLHLAQEIQRQAQKHNIISHCLVQINLGKEESKSGIFAEDTVSFIRQLADFSNIKIDGVMAVLPRADEAETICYYKGLFDIVKSLDEIKQDNFSNKYISAGMSNDFHLAILYGGANMIRLGSSIFGKRI